MKRNAVVIHPDLGIGGAERLIVDLAVALQQSGWSISVVTAHHDKTHCFQETQDGTLSVKCVGDWLPRSIFGSFYALCSYIRMIYAALFVVLFGNFKDVDLIVCDQISACIPFIKLFSKAKIMFYCHFPDQLLTKRETFLKKMYRAPIDWLEEKSTGLADEILVNSNFTGGVFRDTFKSLKERNPTVLYPTLQSKQFKETNVLQLLKIDTNKYKHIFLSINRYERKKKIHLAIESLARLEKMLLNNEWESCYLIIAGGYDERVEENRSYHEELECLVDRLQISDRVTLLKSCPDEIKQNLLACCLCLIYTPDREHFGIVPIEAMDAGKPVIAVDSGGPRETVVNGETGFLCEQDELAFAQAMARIVEDPQLSVQMGTNGKQRVAEKFSFEAFKTQIHQVACNLLENPKEK